MSRAILSVRTDEKLKNSVGNILRELGLNHSSAINIFYNAIEKNRGFPFQIKLPNKETQEALDDLEQGEGSIYNSVNDLFKELDE